MYQAKILAYSINALNGVPMITWELIYPRFIHAELMTHCMLSKNAASSRAIPVSKMIDLVEQNPASPIHWGKNEPGMQARTELEGDELSTVQTRWQWAVEDAVHHARAMDSVKAHKQVVNRILEPFQWMKTVVSGTEWNNFFWLRDHEAADPTFAHLARMMREALDKAKPNFLYPGDWHVPYYNEGGVWFKELAGSLGTSSLEDAISISMSCCAQVSYRNLDDTIEKARTVLSRLNLTGENDDPVHASPSQHQATPMRLAMFSDEEVNVVSDPTTWEDGVTAFHKELGLMSGNLSSWIQKRQLIPGNTRW